MFCADGDERLLHCGLDAHAALRRPALDQCGRLTRVRARPAANVTVMGVRYPLFTHVHHHYGLNDAFDRSVSALLAGGPGDAAGSGPGQGGGGGGGGDAGAAGARGFGELTPAVLQGMAAAAGGGAVTQDMMRYHAYQQQQMREQALKVWL